MNGYMTNGTLEYLEKIKEKQAITPFLIMHNEVKTVAYYEDDQPSAFSTSRDYHVIATNGNLTESGYAVLIFIPTTEEGRPIFEMEYKKIVQQANRTIAARLLRPQHGNTYILLLEWQEAVDYQLWKSGTTLPHETNSDYIKGAAYSETFHVGEKEED
ncbi:hypothetical protein [Gracilibacillus timonensis]|uniref:hypothetical protein n=1 Tax=Gracilibacillus timonensis TaxID=1816696 RepID=UPI000826A085|nr:hypothetical protein [Gracilibacillus timonensis]